MTVRDIVYLPDPILREPSAKVEKIDDEIRTLVEDMFDSMHKAHGIGLAAVQIGVLKRVIICEIPVRDEEEDAQDPDDEDAGEKAEEEKEEELFSIVLINPEIMEQSEELSSYTEGCLSIPDIEGEVKRPASIKVRYMDMEGYEQVIEADGLLATCLQHEIDHTNGKLFIDYLSKLKRDRIIAKFKKAARREQKQAS
jgi:peptide deformylase